AETSTPPRMVDVRASSADNSAHDSSIGSVGGATIGTRWSINHADRYPSRSAASQTANSSGNSAPYCAVWIPRCTRLVQCGDAGVHPGPDVGAPVGVEGLAADETRQAGEGIDL